MNKSNFYFLEVGISYGKHEFFLVFSVPFNLSMRRYNHGQLGHLSVEDWLSTDFSVLLGQRLCLSHPERLRFISSRVVCPDRKGVYFPVTSANSLPDSWISPFVYMIASTFLNLYANE